MEPSIWSLLPPIITILLALITKEVYTSLIAGILSGAVVYSGFVQGNFIHKLSVAINTIFDALVKSVYGDGERLETIIFLLLLGIITVLIKKSNATKAYERWVCKKLKTKRQTLLSTVFLTLFTFIDDFFNCITRGHIMRPICDKNKISREKLAYIIDSTSAPICILLPISSWVAAITSSISYGNRIDEFSTFVKTIPFSLYPILTVFAVILTCSFNLNLGSMRNFEKDVDKCKKEDEPPPKILKAKVEPKSKIIDLLLPIFSLIIFSFFSFIFFGGFFEGKCLSKSLSTTNSARALTLACILTIFTCALLYIPRRIMSFKTFLDSFAKGFYEMASAVIILCLAWTLGHITSNYLNAGTYIGTFLNLEGNITPFIPVIVFLLSSVLAFSTGTSWGTFTVILPIAVPIFYHDHSLLLLVISAILSGSVLGDHISPISSTSIMASVVTKCKLMNHIYSQLPYALSVAFVTCVGYILLGFTHNALSSIISCTVLLSLTLFALNFIYSRKRLT